MTTPNFDWMFDTLSSHLVDFHNSPDLKIGEEFNADELVSTMAASGIECITIFSKDNYGQSYYNTRFDNKHPRLDFDYLGELSQAAKAKGMRVLVYHAFNLEYLAGLRNPDWVVTAKDGTKYFHKPNSEYVEFGSEPREADNYVNSFTSSLEPGYYENYLKNMTFNLICINSPYLQELLWPQLEEIIVNYDIDGFFLDMLFYPVDSCYCQYCKREMAARGISLDDEAAVKRFKRESMFRAVRETTAFVRSVDPNVVVGYDNTSYLGCYAQRDANDYWMFEAALWQLGYEHAPMYARYLRNTGRPLELVTHSFHHMWGDYGGYKHPNEMKYEAATILANGGQVWLGTQAHPHAKPDPVVYAMTREANAFIAERADYVRRATALPSIAVYGKEPYLYADLDSFMFSNPNRNHNFQGATKLLIEAHEQFDFVDDLMDFDRFKVLILPEIGSITEEYANRIRKFVEDGGILVASHLSTLDNDHFALSDVLGVDFVGTAPYSTMYARFEDGLIASSVPEDFAAFGGAALVRAHEGTSVLGKLVNPAFERSVTRFHSHSQTPPTPGTTQYPAATVHQYGKGKAVYVAMPVFSDFFREDYFVYRDFVSALLKTEYVDNPVVSVEAPRSVEISVMEQRDQNRTIVHFTNAQTKRFSMRMPRVEDDYPVYNASFSLRVDRPVKSVQAVPGGEVTWSVADGVLTATLSEFSIHGMVVVEHEG